MAVQCQGDAAVMEQLGEKQDFEAELSRQGFRHEDFELCVRRARPMTDRVQWATYYAVRVTHLESGRRNIYWGGPREDWVGQFVADLTQGMYGAPSLRVLSRRVIPLRRHGNA
jgi:hypothetical protein